jgi:hypothetical protein
MEHGIAYEGGYRPFVFKFEHTPIGAISYGPSHRLVCSFVKYRTSANQIKYYCDLRMNSYNAKQNKYSNSKKGITIPPRCLLDVINLVNSIPLEPPTDLPPTGNRIIGEVVKNKVVSISVSLTGIEGTPKLDIRENVQDVIHDFRGLTYKGVRIGFDMIGQVSNMLQNCYNLILDTGWKPLTQEKK